MITSSDIIFREFLLADYDRVLALWNATEGVEICEGDSREEVGEYLTRNPGLSRVAVLGEEIVGAALCGHDGRRGFIYHLAVAKTARGRGLGKRLVQDCVQGLRAAGLARVIILVAADNALGRDFWLRHGWEKLDALPMTLDL